MRAGAAPYRTRPLGGIIGIDLHYTATSPSVSVEAIARYQTGLSAQEAFPAIAYTYVVTADGVIHWCHDLAVRCWHNGAPGANTRKVGICYTGDVEPNSAQLRALQWLNRDLMARLESSIWLVDGHKDSSPTGCPGPEWPTWKAAIL